MALTPEWVSAAATVASFFVIAISAIAALRQLAHLRAANQSAALLTFTARFNEPEVLKSARFVREGGLDRICNAFGESGDSDALRRAAEPATPILYFWEALGACVAFGMIDAQFVYGTFNPVAAWRPCDRYIAILRRLYPGSNAYDKFEAVVASFASHRETRLPALTESVRRALDLPLADPSKTDGNSVG